MRPSAGREQPCCVRARCLRQFVNKHERSILATRRPPMKHALAILFAAFLLPLGSHAQLTVHGVKYEEGTDVRGTKLVLNGAGTRYKGPFKVYAAGLYMTRKASSP